MSNFLSRLIGRSTGEKSLVRPRVAPAFAPEKDVAPPGPAGEILRSPAEHLPAIAPLPLETLRQNKSTRSSEQFHTRQPKLNLQEQSTPTKQNHTHEIQEEMGKQEASERTQVPFEARVATPESSITPPDSFGRENFETARTSSFEPHDVSIPAVSREYQTSQDIVRSEIVVQTTPSQPRVFPARPSQERNSDPAAETLPKKNLSEPAIQVTIGKIEVRASIAPSKTAEKKTPSGVMSLEEYQRARSRRSAG